MNTVRSVIKGVGAYLPARVITNEDIAKIVDTSDDWIAARTGIRERHIVADGELTSTMGTHAAKAALADAGLEADDIDLIVLATSTPDQTFPATAVTIQAELGINHGAAFDVQAVCSGFIFALATADNYLKGGQFKRALVIGSEAFSRILDWEDRSTCVLFGDGAAAVVVEAQKLNGAMSDRGILATCLRSDGRYRDKLYVDGGPSSTGTVGYVRMDGPEVFRHAVTKISEVIGDTLDIAGYQVSDIDWFVPHQANKRILDGAARKLGLDPSRVVITVDKHANTSAASIPLALNTACVDGRIKEGDLVLLEAMGGGFTWGALLIRW
ncbi:3-oxoacyl-ACP synthase [Methyloceanibacter superfactus]|uniref:Beta-ketoacyl-[acyl-carrier-protein] synthase III n=1 Tax=Methyloceanibacter superfactus TaxID=1774969 RepID=A0A1E3VMS4_9HYPH|nr:beta-ketoacyl-ACP synthase III [Methyloceanibacter superfactus]ODR94266.1 3-oxoacyl-ACP synthase [Methyloceanibacter superfactus]